MEYEKRFATKTGFCHVLPDRIILTRDGIIGNFSDVVVGTTMTRLYFMYGALLCASIYVSHDLYQQEQIFRSTLFGFIALSSVYSILKISQTSTTPIIFRNKIKEVKLRKAIPGLRRAYFEIKFEDENSKTKKRLILLPGSFSGGSTETEKAIKIMEEEKLLST